MYITCDVCSISEITGKASNVLIFTCLLLGTVKLSSTFGNSFTPHEGQEKRLKSHNKNHLKLLLHLYEYQSLLLTYCLLLLETSPCGKLHVTGNSAIENSYIDFFVLVFYDKLDPVKLLYSFKCQSPG